MTVLPDDEFSLAAEFPDATHEEWQRLVEGVLRKTGNRRSPGPAAEDVLATALEDGLTARPLYTAARLHGADPGCPGLRPRSYAAAGRRATRSPAGTCGSATQRPDADAVQRGGPRRPGERRHLAVAGRRRGAGVPVDGPRPRRSTASISTWRPSCSTRGRIRRRRTGVAGPVRGAGRRRRAPRSATSARTRSASWPVPATTRTSPSSRPRGAAGRRLPQRVPRTARAHRRRAAVPRGRRLGRPGARLLARHRRRLPAGADRGGAHGRSGLRPAGVPLRGHRRPVPDHRQTARRAPPVGPRRRGVRAVTAGRRAAPARGHLVR